MTDPKGGELSGLTSCVQTAVPTDSPTGSYRASVPDFDLDDMVNGNLVDTPGRAQSHGFHFENGGLPNLGPDGK